jgi:glutamate-1-semialdehyde aminotransferase
MEKKLLNPGYWPAESFNSAPVFSHGFGHHVVDSNGVTYFDLGLGSGSLIFGHAHPELTEVLGRAVGSSYLLPSPNAFGIRVIDILSNSISEQFTNFVFCNSGSEATQRSLRYARGYSGREMIVSFAGGWHGMNEWTLMSDGDRFIQNLLKVDGIPDSVSRSSTCLEFNSNESLEWLSKNGDRCAGIIIEPIQGSNPQDISRDFLSHIKEISVKHDIPLIFDEIISGFRVALGGATEMFGIQPDICTYGKAIGAGLPVGLVAFNEKIFSKTFGVPEKTSLTGGTFSANPLVLSGVEWALQSFQRASHDALNELGTYFRERLNHEFSSNNIEMKVIGVGSFNRICFTNRKFLNRTQRDSLESRSMISKVKFVYSLLSRKIFCPSNFLVFTCFGQTPRDFDAIIPMIVESALDSRI